MGSVSWNTLFESVRRILRDRLDRRRILIITSGLFICFYALSVLVYVLTTWGIGIQCPFSLEISRTLPGHDLSDVQDGPQSGDWIVGLADQRIGNWQQFIRHSHTLPRTGPELSPADCLVLLGADSVWSCMALQVVCEGQAPGVVRVGDTTWVRVDYARPRDQATQDRWRRSLRPPEDAPRRSTWRRLAPQAVDTVLPALLWFLLKLGLFLVGAIVFWKRPEDPSAPQFFVLCLVTIGAYMGGYLWLQIVTQPLLLLVFVASSAHLPAVSLHFYLLFPRPKAILRNYPTATRWVIYGPAGIFLLLVLTGYLMVRGLYDPENVAPVSGILLKGLLYAAMGYFAVAALWYLLSVVSLVHSYRISTDVTERNQVKWILIGSIAAIVPIGYSLYLAFWEQAAFGAGAATWPMFAASACFTLAFAVSITRYRLMQLDQLLSSGVRYFLVSLLAGAFSYALVFLVLLLVWSQVLPGPSFGQALWVTTVALILLVVLDQVRGRVKKALDRRFRRDRTQLERTLQRMSQAIEQLVDPPALARRLLHTAAELLGVAHGAVYLRQGSPPLYVLADALGTPPPLSELSSGCPLVESASVGESVVGVGHDTRRGERPPPGESAAQRQLRFLGGAVAQPLIHENQLRAMLLLGPREGGEYGPDDLNLLSAFARVTVLALVGSEGHRTIEELNRELKDKVAKIAEQQRRILALQSQLTRQALPAPSRLEAAEPSAVEPGGIIGSSQAIRQLLHQVRKVSASPAEVLIRGESGTGKELLARALHETSPRANKPFVKVHCAALSPGVLESELFGHVKGAFTGAHRDKIGRFEMAHGGSLFLDEIGDIDLSVQTKLLRVLQEMSFERVGSSDPTEVDVRVIAATHQPLEALIREGKFREDLYYRLNVISLHVPPLRDRREDVVELVQFFLKQHGARCGKIGVGIEDDALAALKGHDWPGNIRQLENVIERAVVFAEGGVVRVQDLPPEVVPAESLFPTSSPLEIWERLDLKSERVDRERREREQLVRALARAGGKKAEAARSLGIPRSTFLSRLKKYGLS